MFIKMHKKKSNRPILSLAKSKGYFFVATVSVIIYLLYVKKHFIYKF